MNAFDVFVKEHNGENTETDNHNKYDLFDSCELSILLIWNIRHVWTTMEVLLMINARKHMTTFCFKQKVWNQSNVYLKN